MQTAKIVFFLHFLCLISESDQVGLSAKQLQSWSPKFRRNSEMTASQTPSDVGPLISCETRCLAPGHKS